MKKTILKITAVAATLITLVICVSPAAAIKLKRYYGDIDFDGYVTSGDARAALIYALEIEGGELYGDDAVCADVDTDGKVTTRDAIIILRMATGTIAKKDMSDYEFSAHGEDFTKAVNEKRSKNVYPQLSNLTYSKTLSKAANEAAREFVEETGTALYRTDGSYFYKILDDYGVTYSAADKIIIQAGSGYMDAYKKMQADTQSGKALMSVNFTKIGVGAYTDDGRTFYWCVLLVK